MAASQNGSQKKAEAQDAFREARIENDPAHWKQKFQQVVEREKMRKRDTLVALFVVCGIVVAIVIILELFN